MKLYKVKLIAEAVVLASSEDHVGEIFETNLSQIYRDGADLKKTVIESEADLPDPGWLDAEPYSADGPRGTIREFMKNLDYIGEAELARLHARIAELVSENAALKERHTCQRCRREYSPGGGCGCSR